MQHSYIFEHSTGYVEYLTHDLYFSLDKVSRDNKLRSLRKKYHQKQLKVFCSCKKPRASMVLNYRGNTDSFYISSKDRKQHSESCYYKHEEGDYISQSTIYEKGFVNKDDGKIEIKFDLQDFQSEKPKKFMNPQSIQSPLPSNSMDGMGVSTYKPSVYATMLRLITEAWNDIIRFAHAETADYPKNDTSTLFNQLTKNTVKGYSVKNIDMQDLLYKGEKEGRVAIIEKNNGFKYASFTMLLFHNKSIQNDGDTYRLSLSNPCIGQIRTLDVPASLFINAKTAIGNTPGPYIAGGFVKSVGYKKTPKFISFGLVPISSYGAPVESSHERKLYDSLCNDRRAVIKTVTSGSPSWNGYIPDGLLIDTHPRTILEVFGMSESMESYHEQRAIKIAHFSSLQPKFNFWYWDAFKDKEFPLLP